MYSEWEILTTDDSKMDFIHDEYSNLPEGAHVHKYHKFIRYYYGHEETSEIDDDELVNWFLTEWEY